MALLREPLLHFFAVALVLFALGEMHRRATDAHTIVVTPAREAQLANRYALQFGVQPDEATLAALVERDIEDEVLFRQGLAMQLDKDDEVIRRRVVQKMQFLLEDLNAPSEPSEDEIAAYYAMHGERYVTPARVTFSHVYFSFENGEANARSRATQALERLNSDEAQPADLGDPFPDQQHFSAYEADQVRRLFGRSEMTEAAFTVPVRRWAGPFRSAYGWHVIHVDSRQEPARQALASVREKVRTDYLLDAQERANASAFDEVAREFTVVREKS